jgi:hypothetical protein
MTGGARVRPWTEREVRRLRKRLSAGGELAEPHVRSAAQSDLALWRGLGCSDAETAEALNRGLLGDAVQLLRQQQQVLSRDEPFLAKSQQR